MDARELTGYQMLMIPEVYAAFQEYLMEITWAAAAAMYDRLDRPPIATLEEADADMFAVHPKAVGKSVTAYLMENDEEALTDKLLEKLAPAIVAALGAAVEQP